MSCEPKFVPGFDFDCVKDIISDVRAGKVSVASAQKALWVAGGAVALFAPAGPIGPFASPVAGEVADMSAEELCDALEAKGQGFGADVAAIDPATVLMIIQLVWKILQNWKK